MTRKKTDDLPSIKPALIKVDHARRHISALEAAVAAYIEDPATWEYFTEDDPHEKGRVIAKVRQLVEPPTELALICGDVVHNLRTALDYLIFQLGIADTGMVSDDSQFPMLLQTPPAKVWKSVANGMLGLLSRSHAEEIRKLQPFADQRDDTINTQLGMLHALEIRDKHRLPLVVATAASRGNVTLGQRVRRLQISHQIGDAITIKGDTELFRLKAWGGPSKIDVTAVVQFGIAFGHERGPTPLMLRHLADTVAGVIGSFGVDVALAAAKRGSAS